MNKNKVFSVMGAFMFAATSVLSSGFGGIIKPASFIEAAAADESTLTDGEYVVPVKYTGLNSFDNINFANGNNGLAAHLNARAIIDVEGGKNYVTLGVENWSLYDVFVPAFQTDDAFEYFDNTNFSLTTFPTQLFERETSLLNSEKDTFYTKSEDINTYFQWGDVKDGDIEVIEYNEILDTAYVKFEVQDINKPIHIMRWFNLQMQFNTLNFMAMAANTAYGYTNIILDLDNMQHKDDVIGCTNNEEVDVVNLQASVSTKNDANFYRIVNFSGNDEISMLFNSASLHSENGKIITDLFINDTYDDIEFSIATQKNHQNKQSVEWELNPNYDTFTDLTVTSDDNGRQYITIEYNNELEYIMGKYLFVKYTNDDNVEKYGRCVPVYGNNADSEVNFEYEENGTKILKVSTSRSKYPEGTTISVVKNNPDLTWFFNAPIYDQDNINVYTISLKDSNGNTIQNGAEVDVTMYLPEDFSLDKYYIATQRLDGTAYVVERGTKEQIANDIDFENKTFTKKYVNVNLDSFVIAKIVPRENIMAYTPDKGTTEVYSCNINFIKTLTNGTASMSNNGIVHQAYLVVSTDDNLKVTRKLYFNNQTLDTQGYEGLYIGAVYCNNPLIQGEVYKENTKYLMYATENDGRLMDNCGYDPITEWGCPKRVELTLDDRSYIESRLCYNLAVASPAMSSMTNAAYETVRDDELVVDMVFCDFELQENMTEADVKALFPYDISALTRQVELAKLKIASKKSFSTASIAKVQKAYDAALDAFDGTYDPLNKAEISADKLDKLGTNLENAIKALDSITVAGYNAQLDKDVTFDFYLSMNKTNLEAAEDGDLTAKITKADGSTETVEVGADGKIEFNVAPKEIGRPLTVKIGSYEFTYSVQEYLEKLLWYAENPTEGVEVSEKDAAIAKSLLVYGGYAQDYFVKKDAEANAYVDTERVYANVDNTLPETADNATTFTAPQLGDNIKYYGAAVVFDYTTDIRLYFTVDDAIENHSFAVNDKAVDAVAVDGGYYIAIENIYANQLGNPFKISVDGTDFQYGVYNYIAAALNATEVKSGALNELQALVKALYQYAELTKS